MKLEHLAIRNFVGVVEADVQFAKPVSLFVGRNGQGKSSVKDAIQFALTGKGRAMRFSKDVGNVIRGIDGMLVDLEFTDNDGMAVRAKRSKSTVGVNVDGREVLHSCLNPAEFIALPAKERAKILSEVLGGGMDEVIQNAIAEHVGDIEETVLAELKASGVNILDVDALRAQIVEQRRSYKRLSEALPDKPPLLGDYELDADYDVAKDQEAVKTLADRIAKGGDLVAQARKMVETKGAIIDLQNEIRKLEGQKQEIPNLPRGVSKDKLNMAPIYLSIMETMLANSDTSQTECPVCAKISERKALRKLHDELADWYQKYQGIVDQRAAVVESNNRIDFELQVKNGLLTDAKGRLKIVDVPKGGEDLLAQLQADRDAAQKRMAKHQLWQAADKAYQDAGQQRHGLTELVAECNRIDEALKDGGVVKSAIAAGGRRLPINDSLLKLWGMEQLTWSDNGEITLRGIPIEYGSESERHRAGYVMGLALAEVSGIGIAAIDEGFSVLDPDNANALFEAVTTCKLNNVLVFSSTDKDYSGVELPEWLEVFYVDQGKVARVK